MAQPSVSPLAFIYSESKSSKVNLVDVQEHPERNKTKDVSPEDIKRERLTTLVHEYSDLILRTSQHQNIGSNDWNAFMRHVSHSREPDLQEFNQKFVSQVQENLYQIQNLVNVQVKMRDQKLQKCQKAINKMKKGLTDEQQVMRWVYEQNSVNHPGHLHEVKPKTTLKLSK